MGAPLGGRFHRLWAAATTSNLADGIVLVGAPLVAVQLTRSPELVAGVQVAVTLPWLLFALHIGAVADRRDRRRLMIAGATLRAVVLTAVGVVAASGGLSLPVLYAALLLFGVGEVLFDTSAQSMLPDVVPRTELGRANGRLVGAQTVMERFVGAPVAGVMVASSLALALLGPAVLYVLVVLGLASMPGHYRPSARPAARTRTDIAEGLRFLRGHPTLRALAVMGGALNLTTTAYFSVFVLFAVGAESPMGLPEATYGLLWAGLAGGSVVGSLLAGRLERRFGPRQMLVGSMALFGPLLLTPVFTAAVLPVAAMLVSIGFLAAVANIVSVSSRQRIVPDRLLGRVNSAYRLIGSGGQPLGAVLGGVVAGTFGITALFICAVVLQMLALATTQAPVTDAALQADPDQPGGPPPGQPGPPSA